MLYTMEIYKLDRRTKAGQRLCGKYDYDLPDMDAMQRERQELQTLYPTVLGYRMVIRETMVTRVNIMTGQQFQERYDIPSCCSPASETYWSA